VINLDVIREQIFANPTVRARIIQDYGLPLRPDTPDELASAVVAQFDQTPVRDPVEQEVSNEEVFRAAVKAIGSNSRSWATFLRGEHHLVKLLCGFDPVQAQRRVTGGELDVKQLQAYLPGQSSSGDARAILRWAALLNDVPNYYGRVRDLALAFRALGEQKLPEPLTDAELLLCVAGFLGGPPNRWKGTAYLPAERRQLPSGAWKLPGMGYILTSEFLRNLHWNGFKPDRHVQRLFDRWFPEGEAAVSTRVNEILRLFGRDAQDLRTYLTYSLIGIAASPPGVGCSQVDNLVWLLGAYVEKKGRESAIQYVSGELHTPTEPSSRGPAASDSSPSVRREDVAPDLAERTLAAFNPDEGLSGAVRTFEREFSAWGIFLPQEDVQQRRRGEIREQGWRIQYVFGSVGGVEFFDYYATHRMTNDRHERIYEDGATESLPALADMIVYPADADEDARDQIRREYHQHNARTARLLELKGFL
jgi:hypothetical protein